VGQNVRLRSRPMMSVMPAEADDADPVEEARTRLKAALAAWPWMRRRPPAAARGLGERPRRRG
jgi:hypothetical protein